MKNLFSLKNMVKTVAIFVGMSMGFVGCQKDDLSDHANKDEGKAKLVIDEKPNPGPQPVLSDSLYAYFRGDSLIIRYDSLRNDTIFKSDSTSIKFNANVKRNDDERQTTSARLEYPNMDFTFNAAQNKQNGKMEFFGTQTGSDEDGQEYTVTLNSGKTSFHGWNNVHFILKGTELVRFDNEKLTPKSTESVRVNSTMKWNLTVGVENVPGFDKELVVKANETSHERFILKNAPTLKWREWDIDSIPGNWKTEWIFKCIEHWSNDSVAEPKVKNVTLSGRFWKKNLSDKTVSNLVDYTHPVGTLVWGDWKEIETKDTGVTLYEKEGKKKSKAQNGFDADEFETEFGLAYQEADVRFCDSLFHISSGTPTISNQRNVFVDEASDRDGYSMVRFTDTEVAKWNGEYDVTLDESCKLYLKLKEPELIGFLFDQSVKHSTNEVKVVTIATPQFDNGAEGDTLHFVLIEPETFKCIDNFSFEKVQNVSEVSGAMEKDGELDSTKVTKEVKNGKYTGTYTYYKYTQKYRHSITNDGETKWQHWVSTWYDRFSFDVSSYKNGADKYDVVKSFSASVEKDANHLTKSTSLSTEDLEVWLYSINGTFKLDNVERKDIGNGRITKVVIGENYWDESTKGREITALEVKSWCEFIRFKSDGTKTSQKYTHVFNRVSGTSTWEVSAEKAEEVNGNIIPLAPVDNNRTDDFCHFTARLYEYDMTVDIQGAAQQKDFAKFTEAEEMYFEVEGKKVYFENPTHSISNTVRNLTVKSESDSETVYQHENVWSWNYGGVVTEVTSTGLIHVAKSTPVTPDFDIEVGKIYSTVSRPSNRNASDITAYTYLLVSKDGKKCLPIGIYNNVVTAGEITDMVSGLNSACYVLNENKVVATVCTLNNGIIKYKDANGKMVDGGMFIEWQSAGFNNRGNSYENWQHKYAPRATKKGNVTVVTFEGTNVSYTFKGWNVQ